PHGKSESATRRLKLRPFSGQLAKQAWRDGDDASGDIGWRDKLPRNRPRHPSSTANQPAQLPATKQKREPANDNTGQGKGASPKKLPAKIRNKNVRVSVLDDRSCCRVCGRQKQIH